MKTQRKTLIWILVAVFAAAAGVIYYKGVLRHQHEAGKTTYYCPMHPTYKSDRPGDCPICNMKLVKLEPETTAGAADSAAHQHAAGESGTAAPKVLSIQELLSMKPGEICLLHKCKMGQCMMVMTEDAARQGKCPHCGEDLGVIIKEMAPQGYANVHLDPEKQKMIGVKTAPVQKRVLAKTIRTLGKIAYDPELYQAEQEYVQALESLNKAKQGDIPEVIEQSQKLLDSTHLKLKLMGLSDDLIAEVEKAGQPDRSLLYSDAGQNVWLYAPVYEYEMPLVKIGQKVQVEVPAIAGKKFEGTIRSIDPVLDRVTRTVRARAQLSNPEGVLKPEMYVNAFLSVDIGEVLSVPEGAVFSTGEKNIVFVAKSAEHFEPREITVGAKTDEFYEVRGGLAEGEDVVTSGNFLVDSESRLKAALGNLSSGGGGHQHGS